MADLIINTDLVGPGGPGGRVLQSIGSVAIDRGQPVVYDSATNKWSLASADTVDNAVVGGLCISPCAADGDTFSLWEIGPVILGATLVKGQIYVLSPTLSGKIFTAAELTTGDFVTILGVASSSTVLEFDPVVSGIDRA